MPSPNDRVYTETHEWFKNDGGIVTVGITRYAVDALTDVTFVQMKPVGTKVAPGQAIGEVESVKTTSDIYAAIGGEIVEVNGALAGDPSLLNSDPHGKGWLVKIKTTDAGPLSKLSAAAAYDAAHPA